MTKTGAAVLLAIAGAPITFMILYWRLSGNNDFTLGESLFVGADMSALLLLFFVLCAGLGRRRR